MVVSLVAVVVGARHGGRNRGDQQDPAKILEARDQHVEQVVVVRNEG